MSGSNTKENSGRKIIAQNREARHRFFIHETMEAGLVLTGTEVKSLRAGKVQLADSFALVQRGELFLSHMHISEYSHGNRENHEPTRLRKLLLHKSEIQKLIGAVTKDGMTLVPTQLYFVKGRVKVEIGIAKGKKLHDKRESIKEKESRRDMAKAQKRAQR